MQYVLTEKGNISRPVHCLKSSFNQHDSFAYSFECLCDNGVDTAMVNVFNDSWIPSGYYDSVQSVPLSKFLSVVKQSDNKVL